MAERRTADLRALGAVVRSRLASVCEVWLQPIGTGKHNASYWVHADGCRYVLRVAPPDDAGLLFYERRMMRQEPALHALIRARTRVPVAEVVAHDFTRTQLDRESGPASPSSALSRMRACVRVRAAAFPFDSSSSRYARSCGANLTRYTFMPPHFTGTLTPICNPGLTVY